ncbi:MAG: hypothetical protein ACREOZ_04620, partial [Gloeomargaritales cyanobacterium]
VCKRAVLLKEKLQTAFVQDIHPYYQQRYHEVLHVFLLGIMKYLLKFVFDHKTVPVCLRRWHANQFGPMEEGSLDVRPKNSEWGALKSSFRKAEFERRFRAVTLVASRQS